MRTSTTRLHAIRRPRDYRSTAWTPTRLPCVRWHSHGSRAAVKSQSHRSCKRLIVVILHTPESLDCECAIDELTRWESAINRLIGLQNNEGHTVSLNTQRRRSRAGQASITVVKNGNFSNKPNSSTWTNNPNRRARNMLMMLSKPDVAATVTFGMKSF